MNADKTPLRFAIIGCGRMGRLHIERLHADGRGKAVALYDTSAAVAEDLRRDLVPNAAVHTSFEELLASDGIDAAVICTPTPDHFEQTMSCRGRGWHVLCEKPLADTRERIVQLTEAEQSGGPALSVAYQRRYWQMYRTLRREVRSGEWGPIRAVVSQNGERWQQTIHGTWRDDPAVNVGGFVGDAGSHKIDAVFYVTGLMPTRVYAESQPCGSRVEIISFVNARLDGDVPLNMSFIGNSESFIEDLHIHCEHANLMLRSGRLWVGQDNEVREITDLEPDSDPDAGFLDYVLGSTGNEAPTACALPVFDMTQAILESSQTGRLIQLSK